jgi:tryptophan halogenase
MKNIHIIGGGTAGWLTAMFLQNIQPKSNITLIESKSIGIVGVGEGTTPNIRVLLKQLCIDEEDFQSNTNSTRKIGVNFSNWPGDGSSYNHDFYLSNKRNYAFHFDSYKFGEFFKKKYKERGLNYIQDDVVGFKTNEVLINNKTEQHITKIELKEQGEISTDFVFDCTGFSRKILDKVMKSEWISVKQYLTLNSAITFHLPNKHKISKNTKTRTDSITMKCGWLWRIPLQDRMGCGYLFDSNYISYEDAKKEVEEYLGHSIEVKKRLSFKSGYFKDVWKGNCISIGLSGGFFEPIEATSIMTIIIQLLKLKSNSFDYTKRNFYNLSIRNVNEQILNFIRYHYVCDRDDSKFWQDYKKREMPDKLKSLLNDKNKLKVLTTKELNKILKNPVVSTVFDIPSYLIQSSGNFKKENPII